MQDEPISNYLIFRKPRDGSHSLVTLVADASLEAAMITYCLNETSLDQADGHFLVRYESREDAHYGHILEFIEHHFKSHDEWQIRRLPDGVLTSRLAHIFVGEDVSDIDYHVERCREQFGDLLAGLEQVWTWYLTDGICVCFSSGGDHGSGVLRFRRNWEDADYQPWACSFDELLESLYLGPQAVDDFLLDIS